MRNFNELDFSGLNESVLRFAELSKMIQSPNDNARILAQLISDGLKSSIESANKSADSSESLANKSADSSESLANKSADSSDNIDENNINLTKRQVQILSVMEYGIEYTTENIATLIELKGPRTRQLMNEFVGLGRVESLGTTKDRRYKKINLQ